MRPVHTIAIALVSLCPLAAVAQEPALQGPKVSEQAQKPTLVERDFAGKLKRLEVPPEEAALALLDLSADVKARTGAVLAERAAILDRIVLEKLDLVVQIHEARQGGQKLELLMLLGEFVKALQPLNARGPLADELIPLLPLDKAADFRALVREYNQAAAAEITEEAKSRGERLTIRQATTRESLLILGQEVRRSYERQITSKTAEFERIMAHLNLDSEQETRIRNLVVEYAQAAKGRPTPEQRRALFLRIMPLLDPQQQRTLIALSGGQAAPPR